MYVQHNVLFWTRCLRIFSVHLFHSRPLLLTSTSLADGLAEIAFAALAKSSRPCVIMSPSVAVSFGPLFAFTYYE